jgi:hypothetical protein
MMSIEEYEKYCREENGKRIKEILEVITLCKPTNSSNVISLDEYRKKRNHER